MTPAFLDLLAELKDFQRPRELQPPATAEDIANLVQRAGTELDYTPPTFYLDLLQVTDGLARNGIQMYGTRTQRIAGLARESFIEGLVEANLIWREFEPNKNYVFFAESGSDLYQFNLHTQQFEVADRVGRTVFDQFTSMEQLLRVLFNHMLDRFDVEEKTDA
ncbi:MAG TPA: YrhA family protein [Hymenobacter sp.]|jgi:hypothetical protein